MLSLYIHIPFCKQKCNYCNFYVIPYFSKVKRIKQKYIGALKNEILNKKNLTNKNQIHTIYFGGGTPFELGKKNIIEILNTIKNNFDLSKLQEVSIELNPNPINKTLNFMDDIANFVPQNTCRFSVGIQSLENHILEKSGRNYNYQLIEQFLDNITNKHYKLNLDFIAFGIERNLNLFDNFFKKYHEKIDSVSLYMLELFKGSAWKNKRNAYEDSILKVFDLYCNILTKYKYNKYEISNFAKKQNFESKHNKNYWKMNDYLGFGISASGFIKNIRYTNSYNINDYIKNIYKYSERKKLSKEDIFIEKIFLGLRTKNGIILNETYKKYINLDKLEQFIFSGHIKHLNKKIILTDKGFLVYNYIITELLKKI